MSSEAAIEVKEKFSKILNHIKVNPRPYIIGVAGASTLFLYSQQWKPLDKPISEADPFDSRTAALQAYQESDLIASQQQGLQAAESNVSALLVEENQRSVIALAQQYVGLAAFFITQANHPCNGKTILECLRTFEGNRVQDLTDSSQPVVNPTNDPSQAIDYIANQASQTLKFEALRLAIILQTPVASRQDWQQELLDKQYPVLKAGLPPEELKPRPLTLAKEISRIRDERQALNSISTEQQTRIEACLRLSPEDQAKTPLCQK